MKPTNLLPATVTALVWLIAATELARSQTVNVWVTTDDQSAKLQPRAAVTFSAGAGASNPILVDENQTCQQIEGFGASFTDSAAYLLNEVATAAARSNAMNNLFTRNGNGIGLSFVRNPMGASDLARFDYSYDDLPAGQTDTNLALFSIAHDQADIIPLVQQALQLNPQLKLMANPWSPPGWMKTSGSMIGGSLLPSMYSPFANYFVKYIQAFQAQGIPTHYLSLQNEPLYVPGDYPGTSMDAATQATILHYYLLPALAAANLSTKVLVYDHNWDRPDYPDTVFSDSAVLASSQVAGIAWHGYGGTPGVMLTAASKYPGKGNYETEHSGGTWISDPVVNDFEEIIHVLRSWGKCYVKWSLALDQNHGPNTGGCNSCNPLVTVNTGTGAVAYTIEFYTLGHFSKFILPGVYRVYSANGSGILSAAFVNPDGSRVLVAFNAVANTQTFQVLWNGNQFPYSLAGFSGATFAWTGAQTNSAALNATAQIQAASFSSVSSLQTEPTTDTLGGYDLAYAQNGSYAVYQNVDFSAGSPSVVARVASGGNGGSLEFHLDSAAGTRVATAPLPVTGGWQTWTNVSGSVSGASGIHSLYVVFKGSNSGNLNWFQFSLPAPWLTTDVGSVGLDGTANFAGGAFTAAGSGVDIWGTADAFRYLYQPASGDCCLTARVTSQQNTDPWAKAGAMLRETTAPGSACAAVLLTPGNGVTFQWRAAAGSNSFNVNQAGLTAPYWVRLTRDANSFAAYHSANGVNWTALGTPQTIPMAASALVGLAVCSHNNTVSSAATLDNASVNQAPVLAPITNRTILAGQTLLIANAATDADLPPQSLAFSLAQSPTGASINPSNGVFSWHPAIAQSPATQAVQVVVSDSGVPSLSATQAFSITLLRPARPFLSAAAAGRQLELRIDGDAGPDYTLQASTDLISWSSIVTSNSPALPWFWLDTNSVALPSRFYRAFPGP